MPEYDYWESAYKSGEFKHWEFDYPSPELAATVATDIVKSRARVLDIGCGGGLDAIFLAKCGFRVIGVDISHNALRIARKRARQAHVQVSWCRADAFELSIENATIDFINDRGVFHIIEEGDRPKYSSELFRVLRAGGHILVRGSSDSKRFYPVTEKAIERYFPSSKFKRGPIVPIPLLSAVGAMEARMVVLTKIARTASPKKRPTAGKKR